MEGSIPHPRIGSNGRVSDPPLRQQNSIRCNLLLLYIVFIYFKIASLRYEIAGLIDSFDSYGHVSARRATTWAFIGEHSFSFDMDCALRTKTIELRVASGGFLQVICIIIYCFGLWIRGGYQVSDLGLAVSLLEKCHDTASAASLRCDTGEMKQNVYMAFDSCISSIWHLLRRVDCCFLGF